MKESDIQEAARLIEQHAMPTMRTVRLYGSPPLLLAQREDTGKEGNHG